MTNESKIFDEQHVDCNDCQAYWLDQCDGVKPGSQKPCTAFVATRQTNIPERLKSAEKRLVRAEKWLFWLCCCVGVGVVAILMRLVGLV